MARPEESTEQRTGGARAPAVPAKEPAGGTGSPEAAPAGESNPVVRALRVLGPGLITGCSDDDPSGIGTYATAGASLGFGTLWTAPFTFPLMAAVQYVCAKVGLVTGMGLAGVLRRHYPRWLLYPAVLGLVVANTINAGADIGAIAAGLDLLVGVRPGLAVVPVALVILGLQLWGSYRLIARTFKWLTLVLLAYVGAGFLAAPDWGAVLRATVLPSLSFDRQHLTVLVAILGTTISPYLFFWQASQEVEEEVSLGRAQLRQRLGASDAELRYAAWDVDVGMLFANVVFYFVILTTAATLHRAGQTDISSAAEAAQALAPLAGQHASVLFAVGLIGAGLLAVPVLTGSAAYAVCEAFGWRYGLDEKPWEARQFYGVIALATLAGLALDYTGISPMDALFWTAVLNGFVAPPLLLLIMLIANNRAIMGERTNGRWTNLLGWAATAAMFAAAAGLVLTWGRA
jgi:NRAMP (natural resistance-associated macrophage protein)-like metal ion transporter